MLTARARAVTPSTPRSTTPNSARTIDIDDVTVDVLSRWRHDQRAAWHADGDPVELFAKPDGDLLHPQTLSQAFDRIVARTDLPPTRCTGCGTPTPPCCCAPESP